MRKITYLAGIITILFISFSCSESKEEIVAIKASNNMYVTIPGDTSGVKLCASKQDVGDWEKFIIIYSADKKTISLKANTNLFVSANLASDNILYADKKNASDWEKFTIEDLGNDLVALKANNGKYVSADLGSSGVLTANRDAVYDWEKFTIEKQ